MNGIIVLVMLVVTTGYGVCGIKFGGWNDVATNNENIQRIANWAVEQMGPGYSLIEIRGAQQQVVAGMNYKLQLYLSLGEGLTTTCIVTVFEDLDGTKTMPENYPCTY